MSLLLKIKQDQVEARKMKDGVKGSILTTLYSEAQIIGKNQNRETADDEVIALIKKFVKNNDEFDSLLHMEDVENKQRLAKERDILTSYLPKQLSDEQIERIIENGLFVDIGRCMRFFKEHYPGQYDGAKVKQILEGK